MKTIASFILDRDNNFNLIRLLAAELVIVAHSYTLKGDEWSRLAIFQVTGINPGAFAVDVFFITSGFLISLSFMRQKSVPYYVGARIARIFPALITAVLFNAFIVGPLFTTLPLREYFTQQTLYEFIYINSTLILDRTQLRYVLPSVFLNNPYSAVNGSLWTLPYELWMYIFLLIAGLSGILNKRKWFNLCYILFLLHYFVGRQYYADIALFQQLEVYERFASFFLTGIFFFINKDFIPINWYCLGLLAILTLVTRNTVFHPVLGLFMLSYSVFWVAFIPSGFIRRYNRLGDYSYGLYIYAFPVQQGLIAAIPQISPELLILVSSVITLVFAIISWHLIEKPALKHKEFLHEKFTVLASRYPLLRGLA
jgi:peptidoglycan/LPS O-acetylase OafA/YrhL